MININERIDKEILSAAEDGNDIRLYNDSGSSFKIDLENSETEKIINPTGMSDLGSKGFIVVKYDYRFPTVGDDANSNGKFVLTYNTNTNRVYMASYGYYGIGKILLKKREGNNMPDDFRAYISVYGELDNFIRRCNKSISNISYGGSSSWGDRDGFLHKYLSVTGVHHYFDDDIENRVKALGGLYYLNLTFYKMTKKVDYKADGKRSYSGKYYGRPWSFKNGYLKETGKSNYVEAKEKLKQLTDENMQRIKDGKRALVSNVKKIKALEKKIQGFTYGSAYTGGASTLLKSVYHKIYGWGGVCREEKREIYNLESELYRISRLAPREYAKSKVISDREYNRLYDEAVELEMKLLRLKERLEEVNKEIEETAKRTDERKGELETEISDKRASMIAKSKEQSKKEIEKRLKKYKQF